MESANNIGQREEKTLKSCQECSEWQEMKRKLRVARLLEKAIKAFESRMEEQDFKPTLAEYLKLLQMEKEIDELDDHPKEIRVKWIDPEADCEPERLIEE